MNEIQGMKLDVSTAETFLDPNRIDAMAKSVDAVATDLEAGKGPGSDFLGWLDLPETITEELSALEQSAARARDDSEVYVVIGIGGSYLGARAVIDALGSDRAAPNVLFAGTGLCSVALDKLLDDIADRDIRLCVISKSGTTLEPALAYRLLRARLIDRYGREQAARRITAITDSSKGALRQLATEEGYETFVIADDVGGRFSVLTAVGLLPVAAAGIDIRQLIAGATAMRTACRVDSLRDNPAHLYASCRQA